MQSGNRNGFSLAKKKFKQVNPQWVGKRWRRKKLKVSGVQTFYIEPGTPGENGEIESFNDKLPLELLNREIF